VSSFLERRQRRSDPDGPLLLLAITAPSLAATLRLANDTRDWVSGGNTYLGVRFGFTLPEDQSGQAPRAVLQLESVGRGITDDLETLAPGEIVTARLMLTDRANVNRIERAWLLPMTQVSVNATTASAHCGVDFILRQQAVRIRYTPHSAPGVF